MELERTRSTYGKELRAVSSGNVMSVLNLLRRHSVVLGDDGDHRSVEVGINVYRQLAHGPDADDGKDDHQ